MREVQELWFATRRRPWTTLCVVPAAPGMSAMPVAEALASVGRLVTPGGLSLVNAEGMDLDQVAHLVMQMTVQEKPGSGAWISVPRPAGHTAQVSDNGGSPVILAIESVISNPLVLPLTMACDVVLLCVELGQTELAAARHSVELIGRDRILGTVLIKSGGR